MSIKCRLGILHGCLHCGASPRDLSTVGGVGWVGVWVGGGGGAGGAALRSLS